MAYGFGNRFRGSKYGAQRIQVGDHSYASKLESAVAQQLELRVKAGEIEIERVQDQIHLTAANILYKPDFRIRNKDSGESEWVEAKGFETPEWRIKRRLWIAGYGPGKLTVISGSASRLAVKEELMPKQICCVHCGKNPYEL